jgi:hypothetical protein
VKSLSSNKEIQPLTVVDDCILASDDKKRLRRVVSRRRGEDMSVGFSNFSALTTKLNAISNFALIADHSNIQASKLVHLSFGQLTANIDFQTLLNHVTASPSSLLEYDLETSLSILSQQPNLRDQLAVLNTVPVQFMGSGKMLLRMKAHVAWQVLAPKYILLRSPVDRASLLTSFRETCQTDRHVRANPKKPKRRRCADGILLVRRIAKLNGERKLHLLQSSNDQIQVVPLQATNLNAFQISISRYGLVRMLQYSKYSCEVVWNKYNPVTSKIIVTIVAIRIFMSLHIVYVLHTQRAL